GVVGSGDLEVTAGSGLTVAVSAGVAVLRGTTTGDEGCYVGWSTSSEEVILDAPDGSNPRIDLIVAAADLTTGDLVLDTVAGVAAGIPAVPTPDETQLVLAE